MRPWGGLLLAGLVVAGIGLPAVAGGPGRPQGGKAVQAAAGPKVDQVRIGSKLIRRETGLTEEQDFAVVVTARVSPGRDGRPVRASSIQVYFHGLRVDVGQRAYDAKTGAFTLTLDSEAHMGLLPRVMGQQEQGEKAAHLVVVTALDEGGRLGKGHFDIPKAELTSVRSEVYAAWTDAYGRSHRVDARAARPRAARVTGRPLGLAGPALDARSPLKLRVLSRHAFPATPAAAEGETNMVAAPDGSLGLVRVGSHRTVLVRLAPMSGQVLETRTLLAPPKGRVKQVRWLTGQVHQLAARAGHRFAVEGGDAGRHVALPFEPRPVLGDGYVADFVPGTAGIMYAESKSSDFSVAGCDWQGALRWRLDTDALFPGTQVLGAGKELAITPAPAGALAFLMGSDHAQPDEATIVGLAEIGWSGEVRAARVMVVPSSADQAWVDGGAAVGFLRRRLLVVNRGRAVGEDVRAETALFDMDALAAEPLVVIPGQAQGDASVFGAVVLGDRLVVACGPDGYAVLASEP